jgi:DNA-directed RNA polymerase sigma subunit (sigma70/sigma32)
MTSCGEIAEAMGLSKAQVSKMATRAIEAGQLKKTGGSMQSPDLMLVSDSHSIEGKRETSGNEHGNRQETKVPHLCRSGNQAN